MNTSFRPSRLLAAAQQIRKEHPLFSETKEYQPDKDFLKQVKQWATLPSDQVKAQAWTVPIRIIRRLVQYLAENSLHLPPENLNRMVYLRINPEMTRLLYVLWQDHYENKDLSRLIYQILLEKPAMGQMIFTEDISLQPEVLRQWLNSADIPRVVGKECIRLQKQKQIRFPNRLLSLGVLPSSQLGQKCIAEFLTFCSREDYLNLKDIEMLQTLQGYTPQLLGLFLENILEELKLEDFQAYYQCGAYLRKKLTGLAGSERYRSFFAGRSKIKEQKYHRWMNYLLVRESFAADKDNDERLKFWSRYVPYTENAYRVASSECLVIEFEKYMVIEFTNKTQGALYIYRKDIFENRVKYYLNQKNNDFRSILFQEWRQYAEERIVHNGNWQYRARRYLTTHDFLN